MKLTSLAKELKISTESFIKFIQDFDLELSECLSTNFDVKDDFIKFARENIIFLKKYEDDLDQKKSLEDIAENIKEPTSKIAAILKNEKPEIYDNGLYKSSVSSYGIHNKLGGNYQFVYNYFGKKSNLTKRDFIGYRDLFFYISKTLEPFKNETSLTDWGINKPAGIILYGPPGSGKIFWAQKISEMIDYQFTEVKKYYYGTSFIDGKKRSFNDFLLQTMKVNKTILLMEDFDLIMYENAEKSISSCDEETKEIILHHISHFQEEELLIVGTANSLVEIDKEIRAPGRFDVVIPVFPPNLQERSELIVYNMTKNLSEDAKLMKILIENNADKLTFWHDISSKMKVFSNTMVIDFTQSLKKRIRNIHLKDNSENIKIDKILLDSALREASAKLTEEYLTQVAQFLQDVTINNFDDFSPRITTLKKELENYKVVEPPQKTIGFTHNEENEGVK